MLPNGEIPKGYTIQDVMDMAEQILKTPPEGFLERDEVVNPFWDKYHYAKVILHESPEVLEDLHNQALLFSLAVPLAYRGLAVKGREGRHIESWG